MQNTTAAGTLWPSSLRNGPRPRGGPLGGGGVSSETRMQGRGQTSRGKKEVSYGGWQGPIQRAGQAQEGLGIPRPRGHRGSSFEQAAPVCCSSAQRLRPLLALGAKNPVARAPHLQGGTEEAGARALAPALPVTPSSSSSSEVLPAETKEGFQLHLVKLTAPLVRACTCVHACRYTCEHMCACRVYLRCVSLCAWVLACARMRVKACGVLESRT